MEKMAAEIEDERRWSDEAGRRDRHRPVAGAVETEVLSLRRAAVAVDGGRHTRERGIDVATVEGGGAGSEETSVHRDEQSNTTAPLGRTPLRWLLGLNATMCVAEIGLGWRAESMGLVADGLDMGADAAVYLLALLAVGATAARKRAAARFAGRVQLALALLALVEVGRRAVVGSDPEPAVMLWLSAVALTVNIACLAMLRRHRHGEVHLQAAWIFSATDVQANLGVLAAGTLVRATGSSVPDLVIGIGITLLVLRGALRIRARVREDAERPLDAERA